MMKAKYKIGQEVEFNMAKQIWYGKIISRHADVLGNDQINIYYVVKYYKSDATASVKYILEKSIKIVNQ